MIKKIDLLIMFLCNIFEKEYKIYSDKLKRIILEIDKKDDSRKEELKNEFAFVLNYLFSNRDLKLKKQLINSIYAAFVEPKIELIPVYTVVLEDKHKIVNKTKLYEIFIKYGDNYNIIPTSNEELRIPINCMKENICYKLAKNEFKFGSDTYKVEDLKNKKNDYEKLNKKIQQTIFNIYISNFIKDLKIKDPFLYRHHHRNAPIEEYNGVYFLMNKHVAKKINSFTNFVNQFYEAVKKKFDTNIEEIKNLLGINEIVDFVNKFIRKKR